MSSIAARENIESNRVSDVDWWRQALVYQIYPRSFTDSDGDGLGDLKGVTLKVEYLKALGINAIWLSPFYPSALADGGYDVDNYRDVDPRLGTLDDFDELVATTHTLGLKVVVDIVPNHSSNRHEWFKEALASPRGSSARDRYIFRDGLGAHGELPPADWESVFGGPAWERVPDPDGAPGQWYLHLFAKEQPDFNWDNPEVRADFMKTLRFWSDRGVDGFRIDVAHALSKHLPEDLPPQADLPQEGDNALGAHPFWDRDGVHEIYAEWRRLFNQYDPPRSAVAEAWVHADRRARYASADGLGQAFNFDLTRADFDATQFREIIAKNLGEADSTGASSTWVLSNHDVVRHATRYGLPPGGGRDGKGQDGAAWLLHGGHATDVDRVLGLSRARAASLLIFALPGSCYIYQGEELGLHEVGDIPESQRQDPTFFRHGGGLIGRDGCRVPLPWTGQGPSLGFSEGSGHLPQPEWFAESSIEAQDGVSGSTLELYRRALELRAQLQCAEALEWIQNEHASVLHFARPNGWQSVTNFGAEPVSLPEGTVVLSSGPLGSGTLPGNTTAWLRP